MLHVVISPSAAIRLDTARRFVLDASPSTETLVISASRGAADDFAREIARLRGATFGLYRFSLTQLAARLAGPILARDRLAPTTALGVQAVAARVLFDADRDAALSYFAPVAGMPGFPRALARTLEDLALAAVSPSALGPVADAGADLAELFARFDEQFERASSVDRAAFLRCATQAVGDPAAPYAASRVLLLDVPISNRIERALVHALVVRAPAACATLPFGDARSEAAYDAIGGVRVAPSGESPAADGATADESPANASGIDRVRRYLFASSAPPPGEPLPDVELFSAPGEGREAVEIARRVLREARRGVRFDRMAIALRSPQHYAGLLEHALERAGVPAYFERGTRRPHPAGRAFLSLIACALDNLSARRFAEYLSLAQVPDAATAPPADVFPSSSDEVFGPLAD